MEIKTSYIIKRFFKDYLDLNSGRDDEQLTVDSIKNNVEFKGPSLWILIFATFIASLGLNVNSTAVIIGAMLISPLMGPIMGVGLAVGQNNFELMKRSLKSYFIATIFSVITATIYFSFTPLNGAQSELLARTSPTIYDVFIALVGGLAGIVALTTKEKGNVIPGVAIATALMPPLCTAGFGLATGNFRYFIGAFYLYFINSVFISLATYIGVRVMHFKKKEFVDKVREKLVRKYIVFVTIVTMCPAIYLTYEIVKETLYDSAANKFITEELQFPESLILNREVSFAKHEIKVVMLGKEISQDQIENAKIKLGKYNLKDTKLFIYQGVNNDNKDITNIKKMVLEDFYKNSEQHVAQLEHQLDSVVNLLNMYTRSGVADAKLVSEVKALYPSVKSIAVTRSVSMQADSLTTDTLTFGIVNFANEMPEEELNRMSDWLKARTGAKKMKLIVE